MKEVVGRLRALEVKMDTHLKEGVGVLTSITRIDTNVYWLMRGFWWLVGGGVLFNVGLAGLIFLLWMRK